ncbi:MAG TPA: hypothetical protein VF824_06625 [Thermoanaerobaculia bacterium]
MIHLLVLLALLAETPPPAVHPLTAELQQHRLALTFRDGQLSGPGAELLRRELGSTQFFLIGEEHGAAETARFVQALLPSAWKSGYRHLALEVGPHSIARLGGTYAAVEEWNRRYPWSLPFLSWKEEAEVYATAMKLGAGRRDAVWGVDQEFILSLTPHLERLAALAKTAEQKRVASALLERSRASDRALLETKNPGAVLMLTATAEDFAPLRAAFASGEARRLVDALDESRDIYAKQSNAGWVSNDQRARLIKRQFMQQYDAAVKRGEARPKVVVKIGGIHAQRGASLVGVFDIGTFLPELAAANGTSAFQMAILPRGGFVNAHRPFSPNDDDNRAAYDPAKEFPFDPSPLFDAAPAGEWTVIDLRPLRAKLAGKKLQPLDPLLQRFLFGYDAVVVIPEASPNTLF